jgi:SPP1 gp7 family putative phage head morphogenesis protein
VAATRETIRLHKELQLVIDDTTSGWTRQLTAAWVRSWKLVEKEWIDVTNQLAIESANGATPSRRTLRRLKNVRRALNTTRAMLDELTVLTGGTLVGGVPDVVLETARLQSRIIGSMLPSGELRDLVESRTTLPNLQLDRIVRRTAQQITSTLRPLSAEATEAVADQLIIGAARGQNPRAIASQMLKQVNGAFNGGLSRALNVARTEALDAHRDAARTMQNRHSDVLEGWQWLATLGDRTCPACWSLHGSKHPLSERGPDGHQQCRCSRAPLTKSWAELGLDISEPPSLIRDGQQEFATLPRRQQLEIMGPTRLRALETGRATWNELAQFRHNDGWRDAYYVRPVRTFQNRMGKTA